MLKCCYSGKKYLSKLKQHGLPHILSEEFLFKCLSVMIYEKFVSIVELIMLSWQLILLHNFHNMRVTWLSYHFFKLQVHILHRLGNIWIFNIWKLWLVRCDVISVERASYYRRCPKLSEVKRFPFGDSLTQLSSLITRERLDSSDMHIVLQHFERSFIWNQLVFALQFSYWSSNFLPKAGKRLMARQKWTPWNA